MMNIEKHYKEILKNKDSFAVNEQTGKVSRCSKTICENCKFYYANSCYEYDNCEEAKLSWLLEEYKEPVLTDKEKGYLKNVIEPLGVEVRYIKKWKSIYIEENKCCYNIAITVKHPIMETWERDLMNFAVTKEMPFKRLELDKRYSLKDLGL